MNKTNASWSRVIEDLNLDDAVTKVGYAIVAASELNAYREARLMAKFDHRASLPESLSERGWAILGVSNSSYVVGPISLYHELPSIAPDKEIKYFPPRDDLETLEPHAVASEADAILLAHASGIIDDFVGELTTLTTFGRMRSEAFDFTIENKILGPLVLSVSGTQIEIDGGFEGENSFSIVECKNHACEDFNLRQLYYPYRAWSDRISKIVTPIFMTYSNDVFDLYKYEFAFPDDINSARLVEHARFTATQPQISLQALLGLATKTVKVELQGTSFPQADTFERVLDLVERCSGNGFSRDNVANIYQFDQRQADYYVQAAKFLGLIHESESTLFQTKLSASIWSSDDTTKKLRLATLLLQHSPIADTFVHGNRYSRADFQTSCAIQSLKASNLGRNLGDATLARRAQTIIKWCQWLDGLARY